MMLLEKLAEGSLVGKMQLFGNLADGDALVVEALGGPLDQFVANHFVRCLAQNLFDQTRKMLRRDAEFLSIEVRLMLDGDEAGAKGMERAAAMIRQAGMLCHLFRLPKGEDPDSMFRLMGPTDWITWLRYQWEELYPDPGERLAYRIQKGILLLANEHDPERRQYLLGLLQQRWKETFLNGELKSEN